MLLELQKCLKIHKQVFNTLYIRVECCYAVFHPVKTLLDELLNIHECHYWPLWKSWLNLWKPMTLDGDYCRCPFNENKVEYKVAQFRATHLDLEPGGGCEITIRTLKGVGVQVRPLVVLHVRASMKRLHAYSAGKPLGAQTAGRARSRGRGWSFAAQLTGNKPHIQRGGIRSVFTCQNNWFLAVTSTCCRTPSASAEVR